MNCIGMAGQNPPITQGYLFNSDPDCHVINGRFYLFASHDQISERLVMGNGWETMFDYHCLSTKNFIDWVDHGSILNIHDAVWAVRVEEWSTGNEVWDGDAGIEANGKYYAYIPMGFQLGVFVADKPEGPYRDALGKPLVTKAMLDEGGAVSEASVVFYRGQPYLLFGSGIAYLCKLKSCMTGLDEKPVRITVPEDFVESPLITEIDGRLYFSYSNGGMYGEQEWEGRRLPPPRIMYCLSQTGDIYGPYANPRVLQDIHLNPESGGWAHRHMSSAHQGIACYNGQWYFAYHRDYFDGVHRQVCITGMTVNKDGSLGMIDPNHDPGVTGRPVRLRLDAFAAKREAEEFHERHLAEAERGIRQDMHMKLRNGGWLKFEGMDFCGGASGFRMEASCENPTAADVKIELRLDCAQGMKIGECVVPRTNGKTDYRLLAGTAVKIPGIHNLYIVATGVGYSDSGYLCNVNWFTFIA